MARTIIHSSAARSAIVLPNILGLGGAIAGLAGGTAMAVVAASMAAFTGNDTWLEAREIATTFFGASVANQGVLAVMLGTLVHMLFSAGLGAIYGILYRRVFRLPTDFGTPMLAGMIYSMMIWLMAYFIVLPAMGSPLIAMYAPGFIIQHLVYGVVTGLVYTYLRPQPYIPSYHRYYDETAAVPAAHD